MILVDTSVLLDVLTADPIWADWSERNWRRRDYAAVYAELSVRAARMEDVDAALQGLDIEVVATPRAALFMAGKVFGQYRARGGVRSGVLPDFFVGALAAVERLPLLIRDVRGIRFYFPTVDVIAPA